MGKEWAHHPLKLGVVRLSDHFLEKTIFLVPKKCFPPEKCDQTPVTSPSEAGEFPFLPQGLQALLGAFSLLPWTWSSLRRQIWGPSWDIPIYFTTENQHGTQKWWFLNGPNTHFSGGYVSFRELQIPLIEKLMCQWATGCCVPKCFTRRGSISILTFRYSWAGGVVGRQLLLYWHCHFSRSNAGL